MGHRGERSEGERKGEVGSEARGLDEVISEVLDACYPSLLLSMLSSLHPELLPCCLKRLNVFGDVI